MSSFLTALGDERLDRAAGCNWRASFWRVWTPMPTSRP